MKNQVTVIVKRRKRRDHGHHGGAWKVAYADFVTALMAFFLVMWIVGQSKAVRAAVAGYFRDPGVFEQSRAAGILPAGGGAVSFTVGEPPGPMVAGVSEAQLRATADRIRSRLQENANLPTLRNQVELSLTPEGLQIELVDSDESVFFDTGSAQVKEEAERILALIAGELVPLDAPVVLEGHTDSRQYASADHYTNWELSADRANAARRVMEISGLPAPSVVSVRGYADRRLRRPNAPLDARNRRVSIIVTAHADRFKAGAPPDLLDGRADPAATETPIGPSGVR